MEGSVTVSYLVAQRKRWVIVRVTVSVSVSAPLMTEGWSLAIPL